MSDSKKSRNPQISTGAFITGMVALRHKLERPPTLNELTTFFNTHIVGEGGWVENPEGFETGTRNHLSISSRLSQVRAYVEEQQNDIGEENVKALLAALEVTGMERVKADLRSIVSDIRSLGILLAPANMVKNSNFVGTNGQPVKSEWVEV